MKYIVAALLFLFPTSVVRFIANLTGGYRIARGARCCIMPGVTINDGVIVGAQTCVNKNLDKVGLYVSSLLRFIEYDVEEKIKSLGEPVCENRIYRKD